MTAITGNTYPVRAELRGLGGTWNAAAKAWMVPDDQAEYARSLVGDSKPKARRQSNSGGGYRRMHYLGTDEGGHAHFGGGCNCEDYPCCGH